MRSAPCLALYVFVWFVFVLICSGVVRFFDEGGLIRRYSFRLKLAARAFILTVWIAVLFAFGSLQTLTPLQALAQRRLLN